MDLDGTMGPQFFFQFSFEKLHTVFASKIVPSLFLKSNLTKSMEGEKKKELYGWKNILGECQIPIVCADCRTISEVLEITYMPSVFHSKIHMSTDFSSRSCKYMEIRKSLGFGKLLKRLEHHQDHLRNGKMHTSATGLFNLAQECVQS